MPQFPPQLPHGEFQEILPDIFFPTGQIKVESDPVSEFSRNMVVIRDGMDLTLVNSIRLNSAGFAALDHLGTVKSIVRLGGFHGRDDAFYLNRYKADLWTPEGVTFTRGEKTDQLLLDGQAGPIPGSSAFVFDTPELPEAILYLKHHGGILIVCDSFQNMRGPDKYFNDHAAESKARLGFFKQAVIGPGWRKFAKPVTSDVERVLEFQFSHLLSAHGEPLLDDAYRAVAQSVKGGGVS